MRADGESGATKGPGVGDALPWVMLASVMGVLAAVVLNRELLNDRVEHDFVANFMSEARRLLNGEPLTVKFHPPFYAFCIARLYQVVGDWWQAGLWLAWASAGAAMAAAFVTFDRLAGRAAALGALCALAVSATFLRYSTLASSDVFFVALYYMAWCLAACYVASGRRAFLWSSGVVVAFAVLTRTNGLTLAALLLLPLLATHPWRRRLLDVAAMLAGFAIPMLLWAFFAWRDGMPLAPTMNHVNMAMTYFSPTNDRITGEALRAADARFDGTWAVLTHDPAHMARTYARDLFKALAYGVWDTTARPLVLLGLPGLVLLWRRLPHEARWTLLLATIGQVLLLNFKAYETRHHLFLVPILGAGAGLSVAWLLAQVPTPEARLRAAAAAGLVAACGAAALVQSGRLIGRDGFHDPAFADEAQHAVPALRGVVPADAVVLARKSTVPYHLGVERSGVANEDPDALVARMNGLSAAGRPVYLYAGRTELRRCKGVAEMRASGVPPWLEVAAESGDERHPWVLYRFKAAEAIAQAGRHRPPADAELQVSAGP